MGSSGGGSLSDYSNQQPTTAGAGNGGFGQVDKCAIGFATSLEEVARCAYYIRVGLPPVGADVTIAFHSPRLVVIENSTGLEVGYLPTKFNYIKNCMDSGFSYAGSVRSNAVSPVPSVFVDIVPVP